jgi:hypothetical protein
MSMDRDAFIRDVLRNPINRAIVGRLPSLGLPDCWLVSGALFQTIWNLRAGQPPENAIRDYDVFYFDPDTSYEAEDRAIARAETLFADVGAVVELRNQARVHLWYEKKFASPYPPLGRATEGIDRFLMHCAQVGIRSRNGGYDIYAPHGFADIEGMVVRPNRMPNFRSELYLEKALRWKGIWPQLTVLPATQEASSP